MEYDIKKIKKFFDLPHPYEHGVFLVFGPESNELKKFLKKYKPGTFEKGERIYILWHNKYNEKPMIYNERS